MKGPYEPTESWQEGNESEAHLPQSRDVIRSPDQRA
jgi:hypothetical protein